MNFIPSTIIQTISLNSEWLLSMENHGSKFKWILIHADFCSIYLIKCIANIIIINFTVQTTLNVLEMCNHLLTLNIPLSNLISIVIKIDILRSYFFFLFRVTRNTSLYQGRLLSAVTLANVGYCALVKVRTYLDSLPINIALLTKLEDEPLLRPCQVLMGFHYHYQF